MDEKIGDAFVGKLVARADPVARDPRREDVALVRSSAARPLSYRTLVGHASRRERSLYWAGKSREP